MPQLVFVVVIKSFMAIDPVSDPAGYPSRCAWICAFWNIQGLIFSIFVFHCHGNAARASQRSYSTLQFGVRVVAAVFIFGEFWSQFLWTALTAIFWWASAAILLWTAFDINRECLSFVLGSDVNRSCLIIKNVFFETMVIPALARKIRYVS